METKAEDDESQRTRKEDDGQKKTLPWDGGKGLVEPFNSRQGIDFPDGFRLDGNSPLIGSLEFLNNRPNMIDRELPKQPRQDTGNRRNSRQGAQE